MKMTTMFYRDPRRGKISWIVFAVALLYSVVAIGLGSTAMMLGIPIALLGTIPELLPQEKKRTAGYLRMAAFVYLFLTPILYLALVGVNSS